MRRDLRRKLRRLAARHAVLFDRALNPKRRPRPKPMRGDLLRRIKRLEAAIHIRDKRRRAVERKPRRLDP